MNERTTKWLKIILGLFLVLYALNKFFHFIPMSYGQMPEEARQFLDATLMYLPYLYVFEIIIGLLLIFNKYSTFILIVLFPLSVVFLMFSIINKDLSELWPALFVALLNIILLINDRDKYKVLFN